MDGFQGREKELIVLSTVRANEGRSVGFLADARRLNVAITRARRGLVVVGQRRTLAADGHWAAWLAWVDGERLAVGGRALDALLALAGEEGGRGTVQQP